MFIDKGLNKEVQQFSLMSLRALDIRWCASAQGDGLGVSTLPQMAIMHVT